jgi:hypothetical protein
MPHFVKTEFGWEVWMNGRFLGTYPSREWADEVALRVIREQ